MRRAKPGRRHARSALHAGATLGDLVAATETALVSSGIAANTLGIDILAALDNHSDTDTEAVKTRRFGRPRPGRNSVRPAGRGC